MGSLNCPCSFVMAIALVSVTLYCAIETLVEVFERENVNISAAFFLDYEWPLFRLDHPT